MFITITAIKLKSAPLTNGTTRRKVCDVSHFFAGCHSHMPGSVKNMTKFVYKTNMTIFVLNMTILVLNVTGIVLNMT